MQTPPNNEPEKFRIKLLARCEWEPKPMKPPVVDPQMPQLHPLSRSAESILFSLLSFEFWISPNGQVREWLRHNSRLAVVLAIPVFLVMPIVTCALWQLVSWLTAITSIAGKLIIIPILIVLAAVVISVAVHVLRVVFNK
jgi:hypothetical protein